MADNSANVARIWAVMGASGTGKGLWIKQQLRALKPRRLIVWDFKDEYREFAPHTTSSTRALLEAVKKAGEGGGRFRFITQQASAKGMQSDFEAVCNIAYAWENCTFIAEELSNVTNPSYAPPAWRKMTTSGRHANVHIIGASQTPATIDKSFLGNCTLIHVSKLRMDNHRKAVASAMDIDVDRITKLAPFEFIEKDFDTDAVIEGRVKIPARREVIVQKAQIVAEKQQNLPKKEASLQNSSRLGVGVHSVDVGVGVGTKPEAAKPSTRWGFF